MRIIILSLIALINSAIAVAQPQEPGFVDLIDGNSLTGWIGAARDQIDVDSGVLVSRKGCSGKLLTEREYEDFVLRFDFKLTPGANNGLAIRAPKNGDAAYAGIELQILDNPADAYKELQDYQYHGSAYGIAPAKRGALKPVGEWNSQEVVCRGRDLKVVLNDQVILDVNLDEVAPNNKTIDGKEHPGLKRGSGHVGFLCHGDVVSFRNVRIKELKGDAPKN